MTATDELDLVALRKSYTHPDWDRNPHAETIVDLIDRLERAEETIRLTAIAKDKTHTAAIEECQPVILSVLDQFCIDYLDEDGWTDSDELRHRLIAALRELKGKAGAVRPATVLRSSAV